MMNIPFYYDVYRSPHDTHCCPDHPRFKGAHVSDESRIVQLTDVFGNLRYLVALSSDVFPDGKGNECTGYWFECVICYPNDKKDVILRYPQDGYEIDYCKVEHEYKKCIDQYKSLLEAECRDFRDINVYKDKIDYEVLKPDCCKWCKWCRCKHDPWWKGPKRKEWLECHNPKNEQEFKWMSDFPDFPNKHHRYENGWHKLPWQKHCPDYGHDKDCRPEMHIYPKVEPLGKCKNFERLEKPSQQDAMPCCED